MRYLVIPLAGPCCRGLPCTSNPGTARCESAVVTLAMHRAPHARRAHGWRFDHAAFVASFRSARTRAFLAHLRESQCYEVFINERLRMASQEYADIDTFEAKVLSLVVVARARALAGHVLHHDWSEVAGATP